MVSNYKSHSSKHGNIAVIHTAADCCIVLFWRTSGLLDYSILAVETRVEMNVNICSTTNVLWQCEHHELPWGTCKQMPTYICLSLPWGGVNTMTCPGADVNKCPTYICLSLPCPCPSSAQGRCEGTFIMFQQLCYRVIPV